jgi:hypothetical protein
VSKQGFQLETHSALGFGNETICPSRGISDSAVKLSALAVRLEKSSWLLICRYWQYDLEIFIEERISFADLVRSGIFSLALVESLRRSLSWAHPSSSCCVWTIGVESSFSLERSRFGPEEVELSCGAAFLEFAVESFHLEAIFQRAQVELWRMDDFLTMIGQVC